ncbi:PRC-barrel domain-containing protein [Aureimonas sp. SK2]|uniref:PRC-barrel domain-containing protein n=1 Tax=Aureimonas sp. SK2 TaxID=3015992 RepID=UPI002444A1DC|nr:PRC-barrel domain-containing protein [Aureimonas sp. SK2]
MKALLIALSLATATIALPASAQVVTVVELRSDVIVQPFGLTVGKLERTAITDAAGNRLGDIKKVVGTAEQGPTALVIKAENSETAFIVPLSRFKTTNGVITVDITAAELAKLPQYNS